MWSDPEDIDTWAVSPRGAGWLFGSKVTSEVRHRAGVPAPPPGVHARALTGLRTGARRDGSDVQFTHVNGLALVARAHQLVQEGYKYMFPEKNLDSVVGAQLLLPLRQCRVHSGDQRRPRGGLQDL